MPYAMKIIFFFNANEKDRGIDLNKEIRRFVFSEKNKNTLFLMWRSAPKGKRCMWWRIARNSLC